MTPDKLKKKRRNERGQRMMQRYPASTRINHWSMAMCFILLGLSGLAFYHPPFFFFSDLLGGPVWSRLLHPYLGVVFFLLFVAIAVHNLRYNWPIKNDIKWMMKIGKVLNNDDHDLPAIGKFNPGQKMVYWTLIVTVPVLLITGVIMWRPLFAGYFPIPIIRIAALLHATAAFLAITTIIVHIYAAIWVKGSIKAMTRGWVTRAWAKHHHPLWYEHEVEEEIKQQESSQEGKSNTSSSNGNPLGEKGQ